MSGLRRSGFLRGILLAFVFSRLKLNVLFDTDLILILGWRGGSIKPYVSVKGVRRTQKVGDSNSMFIGQSVKMPAPRALLSVTMLTV